MIMRDLSVYIGKRYGRLIVTRVSPIKKGHRYWLECLCDCGSSVLEQPRDLEQGSSASCGCLRRELQQQKTVEMLGKKYGRLTVLELLPPKSDSDRLLRVRCLCDCGNSVVVAASRVRSGVTTSCGCYNKDITSKTHLKHGFANKPWSREYSAWVHLRQRCLNANNPRYHDYGGRGITVCDRWKDSFENFLEDMGECPKNKSSLDRIDNDGPYSPENCRWADDTEQANNSRHCKYETFNGVTKSTAQWIRDLGLVTGNVYYKIYRGIPRKEALGLCDV